VAVDNARIVGARPFWFTEMWVGDKKVKTAQHCNTMVHPEYRKRGIFNKMGQFAVQYLKDNDYALTYGFPGPMSRPGFLSQGYKIVDETESMFLVIHPQKLLLHKLSSKTLAGVLGFLYNEFLNAGAKKTTRVSDSFQVEVSDGYTDDLKEVDELRDRSGINLVRSESYLRWRFDKHPQRRYRYVIAKKDGKLWGYAVISAQPQGNELVYGLIVDYLVKDKDLSCFRVLTDRCLKELTKSGSDILMVWVFSEPCLRNELLKRFGFKSSVKFPYSKMFGYPYLDAMQIDERFSESIDIYDRNSWRLTHAFADTA
jgi:predicted GNAT family acetyltransferase